MSELTFEQMLEESCKTIHNGEVVEGTVIAVKPEEIILNIGYKADGIVTRNEYSNTPNIDLTTVVNIGDKMDTKVIKVNDGDGQVLLSYKRLAFDKGNKRIEEAFENKEVLKAEVAQVLDGGLSVLVEESRVFIPASLVSDRSSLSLPSSIPESAVSSVTASSFLWLSVKSFRRSCSSISRSAMLSPALSRM